MHKSLVLSLSQSCRLLPARPPVVLFLVLGSLLPAFAFALLDDDRNGMSDVWEQLYGVRFLDPLEDSDGDGLSNLDEAHIGSNPLDPESGFFCVFDLAGPRNAGLRWDGVQGFHYTIEQTSDPALDWQEAASFTPESSDSLIFAFPSVSGNGFFRLRSESWDTDEDGLDDWEERMIGFNPRERYTDRWHEEDDDRVRSALRAPNVVTIGVLDETTREDWPGRAAIVVRRRGGLDPLQIDLQWGGSASAGDYVGRVDRVTFAAGENMATIEVEAVPDSIVEGDETIEVRVAPSVAYTARADPAVIKLIDKPANGRPGPEEAGRFLTQATFGPNKEELASVQALGFSSWIEDQFTKEVGLHEPILQEYDEYYYVGGDQKMLSWWKQAVEGPDPLRQRVAFALSEILVISDVDGALGGQPMGMVNYYDMLVRNAFGNFRDLLMDVTLHPCMGRYLSSVGNMAPDPDGTRFPDENYAREIMQLFTIGLWELNPDGTLVLDNQGHPVPTYSNEDVHEYARVFTGLNYEGNNTAQWWRFFSPRTNMMEPMRMWDGPYDVWNDEIDEYEEWWFHDPNEKHLLGGVVVSANQRGMVDIEMAIDSLFNHPNVGPFIALRLIQRLVKSNPNPDYIERVASAFDNNGSGVRGDLKAVIRAILLDPEARDAGWLNDATHGRLQEPYLRMVKLARAFDAKSPSGWYPLWGLQENLGMQPMRSPSVFNFFQPDFQPTGALMDLGLVAPEFQIATDDQLFRNRNQFYQSSYYYFNRWVGDEKEYEVRSDYSEAYTVAHDADALVRYVNDVVLQGTASARDLAIVSAAIQRINEVDYDDRISTAVYLLSTTTASAVHR